MEISGDVSSLLISFTDKNATCELPENTSLIFSGLIGSLCNIALTEGECTSGVESLLNGDCNLIKESDFQEPVVSNENEELRLSEDYSQSKFVIPVSVVQMAGIQNEIIIKENVKDSTITKEIITLSENNFDEVKFENNSLKLLKYNSISQQNEKKSIKINREVELNSEQLLKDVITKDKTGEGQIVSKIDKEVITKDNIQSKNTKDKAKISEHTEENQNISSFIKVESKRDMFSKNSEVASEEFEIKKYLQVSQNEKSNLLSSDTRDNDLQDWKFSEEESVGERAIRFDETFKFESEKAGTKDVKFSGISGKEIADQIIEKLEIVKGQKDSKVIVKLKPDFLGEVEIEVRKDEMGYNLKFSVEDPEVKEYLRLHLGKLTNRFLEKGINVDKFTFSDFTRDGGSRYKNRDFLQSNSNSYRNDNESDRNEHEHEQEQEQYNYLIKSKKFGRSYYV